MRKNTAAVMALAAMGGISALASVAKAGNSFVDNFDGSASDQYAAGGTWSSASYESPSTSSVTDPVGGPLTLSYTGAVGTKGGPKIYTALGSEVNPFVSPVTLTMTAAPGGNLIPGTDTTTASPAAVTYLGIDGVAGQGLDGGADRIVFELTNLNYPIIAFKNSTGATTYSDTVTALPSGPNIDVTSMFLFMDGTQESSDHFYCDFGETYVNTMTHVVTTWDWTQDFLVGLNGRPFDLGDGYAGYGTTQANLNLLAAGFAGGASLEAEVINQTTDQASNEAVALSQITDEIPDTYVPEPASLGIAAAGMALLFRRNRRRA